MIPPDFAISVAAIGSDIRLTVDGELDIVNAGELADAVGAAAGPAGDVVVDLAGVTFIDSTAIHALIDAQHLLTARGQRLRLATPTRIVTRVLDLSGLARNFTIDTARPGSIAASAPAGEPGLEAILHALARHLLTERSLRDDLERILGLAGDSIPPCAAGSIALLVDGQPITVAVNEQLAWELDLAQYESREGPCLEALHGEPIRVDDLDVDARFAHFSRGRLVGTSTASCPSPSRTTTTPSAPSTSTPMPSTHSMTTTRSPPASPPPKQPTPSPDPPWRPPPVTRATGSEPSTTKPPSPPEPTAS